MADIELKCPHVKEVFDDDGKLEKGVREIKPLKNPKYLDGVGYVCIPCFKLTAGSDNKFCPIDQIILEDKQITTFAKEQFFQLISLQSLFQDKNTKEWFYKGVHKYDNWTTKIKFEKFQDPEATKQLNQTESISQSNIQSIELQQPENPDSLPQLKQTKQDSTVQSEPDLNQSQSQINTSMFQANSYPNQQIQLPTLFSFARTNHNSFVLTGGLYALNPLIWNEEAKYVENPFEPTQLFPSNQIFKLEFETNRITIHKSDNYLEHPRVGHSMVIHKGFIYVFGGNQFEEYFSHCERIDIKTLQSTPIAPMKQARSRAYSVVYNDKIYVFGGFKAYRSQEVHNDCEVYDPKTDKWETIPFYKQMNPVPQVGANIFVRDNKVYVLGGINIKAVVVGSDSENKQVEYEQTVLDQIFEVSFTKRKNKISFEAVGKLKTPRAFAQIITNGFDSSSTLTDSALDVNKHKEDSVYLFGGTKFPNVETFILKNGKVEQQLLDHFDHELKKNGIDYLVDCKLGNFLFFY